MYHRKSVVYLAITVIITVLLSSCSLFLEVPVESSDVVFGSTEEPYSGPIRDPLVLIGDYQIVADADGVRRIKATDGIITISYVSEYLEPFKANGTVEIVLTDPLEHQHTDILSLYAMNDRTVVSVISYDLILAYNDGTENLLANFGQVKYWDVNEKQNGIVWEINIKDALDNSNHISSISLVLKVEFSVYKDIILTTMSSIGLSYEQVLNEDAYGEIGLFNGNGIIGLKNGGNNNSLVRSISIPMGVSLVPDADLIPTVTDSQ